MTKPQPRHAEEAAELLGIDVFYLGVALPAQTTKDGTYVAVPQRSWRPVTVSAVQTTVLKLDPQ